MTTQVVVLIIDVTHLITARLINKLAFCPNL